MECCVSHLPIFTIDDAEDAAILTGQVGTNESVFIIRQRDNLSNRLGCLDLVKNGDFFLNHLKTKERKPNDRNVFNEPLNFCERYVVENEEDVDEGFLETAEAAETQEARAQAVTIQPRKMKLDIGKINLQKFKSKVGHHDCHKCSDHVDNERIIGTKLPDDPDLVEGEEEILIRRSAMHHCDRKAKQSIHHATNQDNQTWHNETNRKPPLPQDNQTWHNETNRKPPLPQDNQTWHNETNRKPPLPQDNQTWHNETNRKPPLPQDNQTWHNETNRKPPLPQDVHQRTKKHSLPLLHDSSNRKQQLHVLSYNANSNHKLIPQNSSSENPSSDEPDLPQELEPEPSDFLRKRRRGTLFRDNSQNSIQVNGTTKGSERDSAVPKVRVVRAGQIVETRPKSHHFLWTIPDPGSQKLNWHKQPLTVLVVKKIYDESVLGPFKALIAWLIEDRQMIVFVESNVLDDDLLTQDSVFSKYIGRIQTFKEAQDDLTDKIDFIICLGGDGTLLHASTLFQQSCPPVMAFHQGSLGFLTPFNFDNYQTQVSQVLDGNASLLLRYRLKCVICKEDSELGRVSRIKNIDSTSPCARSQILVLNEVVVDRGSSSFICNIDLYVEGRLVTSVQGDGLIISTPTGSTAYAVAAGASMIHPNVPAIMITPICPHSLSFRPIVVPAGVELKIMLSPDARNSAMVSFDGRNRQEILKGDSVRITTAQFPLPAVCAKDQIEDWFDRLAECLHWNVRKSQKSIPVSRTTSDSSLANSDLPHNRSNRNSVDSNADTGFSEEHVSS